jgi:hypothetical protein
MTVTHMGDFPPTPPLLDPPDPNNPGGLPGIDEEPPAIKEGNCGGPIQPVAGGSWSKEDKELFDWASDSTNLLAAAAATGAAGSTLFVQPEAAVPLGVISGVSWFASGILAELVEDPPQPHKRIVAFRRRRSIPPGMSDPIFSKLGIASQYGLATAVTARGSLDAIERLAGALDANDYNWAVTHNGVAIQTATQLPVDLATYAAALNAAGPALAGSAYDHQLDTGAGGVKAWIDSPGTRRAMTAHLRHAGLLPAEIDAVIAWWQSDPTYTGPPMRIGERLTSTAVELYDYAVRLAG